MLCGLEIWLKLIVSFKRFFFFAVIKYFVVFIKNFKKKLTVYHGSAAALLILLTLLQGELAFLSSKSGKSRKFFFIIWVATLNICWCSLCRVWEKK